MSPPDQRNVSRSLSPLARSSSRASLLEAVSSSLKVLYLQENHGLYSFLPLLDLVVEDDDMLQVCTWLTSKPTDSAFVKAVSYYLSQSKSVVVTQSESEDRVGVGLCQKFVALLFNDELAENELLHVSVREEEQIAQELFLGLGLVGIESGKSHDDAVNINCLLELCR